MDEVLSLLIVKRQAAIRLRLVRDGADPFTCSNAYSNQADTKA
jgi:hypothetical protein